MLSVCITTTAHLGIKTFQLGVEKFAFLAYVHLVQSDYFSLLSFPFGGKFFCLFQRIGSTISFCYDEARW